MNTIKNGLIQQAGAIVFRKVNNTTMVLLVRSKKNPTEWVFPKGHMESGETEEQTASRELLEEAGVVGKTMCSAGVMHYSMSGKKYRVSYFLFEYLNIEADGEPGRTPSWFAIEQALNLLSINEMKELLQQTSEAYSLQ